MTVRREDQVVATVLAEEVTATEIGKTWRKVTTLLDLFGAYRLTPEVRARLGEALAGAGLAVKPSLVEVERFETVRLSFLADEPISGRDARARSLSFLAPITDAVWATEWHPGVGPSDVSLLDPEEVAKRRGVLWVDVDVLHTEPDAVFEMLSPSCPGLTRESVGHLFSVDPLPRVRAYGERGSTRFISAFGVIAEEGVQGGDDPDWSKAGALVFQLVELLSGDDWLITCWHRSRRYEGAEEIEELPPRLRTEVREHVEYHWSADELSTAGDLGTLILYELARTYPAASRVLRSWLEQWELDFHRRYDGTERRTLIDLRSLLAEYERRLTALEQAEEDVSEAWYRNLTSPRRAKRLRQLVARSLHEMESFNRALRGALDLLALHGTSQQLRLLHSQSQRGKRLERKVAIVTSVLLVPTLIAGVFGANTKLPWGGRWEGLVLMLGLMILASAIAYVVIRPSAEDDDAVDP
jgi:hypothetical protein